VSILLALFIGLPLGLMAGFYGGRIDQIIMRCMDVILAFPIILLAIVIMVILEPSTWNVVLALGIVRIPILARLVRSSVLSVKENEYIEVAGAGAWPPRAAQLFGAHHRYFDTQRRQCHHHRGHIEFSWTRDAAPNSHLGLGSKAEPHVD
jgi:ABC-type dipeptide/oligopeptide/nickel transport system permease subunit